MLRTFKAFHLGALAPIPNQRCKDFSFSRTFNGLKVDALAQEPLACCENFLPFGIYPRWILSYVATAYHLSESTIKFHKDDFSGESRLMLPRTLSEMYKLFGVKNKKTQRDIREQWRSLWQTRFDFTVNRGGEWLRTALVYGTPIFSLWEPATEFYPNGMPMFVKVSEQMLSSVTLHCSCFSSSVIKVSRIGPQLWDVLLWLFSKNKANSLRVGYLQLSEQFNLAEPTRSKKIFKLKTLLKQALRFGKLVGFEENNGIFTLKFKLIKAQEKAK